MLVAVIAFNFRRGGDISTPYVQSVRLIAKNAVLWVMFLASMGASVFFSFDSHFNAIFSAEQRKRAAEIRTLNQVGRVVADIGERAQKVQLAEAERLFETDGWKAYDTQLTKLAQQAQGSQGEIEKYFVTKMEERRRGIAEQQERISGAERNQTALLQAARRAGSRTAAHRARHRRAGGGAGEGAGHLQCDQGRPSPPSASRPTPKTAASKAR